MSTHFIFPKPQDWNTLEDIVADVFSRKYRNYNFQRYGRNGQRQSGVDIAGPTEKGLIGIQCKHHPNGNISSTEIDEEVKLSDGFSPRLGEFVIATSAERDTTAHNHVLKLSLEREKQGKYPVVIKFWEDIYNWLVEYPDMVYKHFTKYFPTSDLEDISMPGILERNRYTARWPVTLSELEANTNKTVGGIDKVGSYKLALGLTSFRGVSFDGLVDLDIQLADLYSNNGKPEDNFIKASEILNSTKALITEGGYSKELTVYLQARLSLSFLLGWTFRRVTHYELKLIYARNVWATNGLPPIPARLTDGLPTMRDPKSREVILILNISRDITSSILEFAETWENQPLSILSTSVEGHTVSSAAHALSVALELSRKIKNLIDSWGIQKIHLFGVMPAALATLIGYNLNAICPIHLYFLDDTRSTYKLGGVLDNSL